MKLNKKQQITLYTNLVRAKAFDEMFVRWLSEGKLLGFYHSSEGAEAPGVGACSFLRKDDFLWPHIRGHGIPHMLSKGIDIKYYLAEHVGKSTGMCGGMSTFHSCDPEHGLFGWSGSIGSGFPVTVGYGLAAKKNGKEQVVVSCFGDGTSNRGTLHESFLMAANWKLPVVWVCENNGLSIFVPFERHHPVEILHLGELRTQRESCRRARDQLLVQETEFALPVRRLPAQPVVNMDPDEQEILDEVHETKRLVKEVLEKEDKIEQEEQKIEAEERTIENKQERLLGGLSALKFANIQAWKQIIWDQCEARISKQESREIDYDCKLLKAPCRFEHCPKNKA